MIAKLRKWLGPVWRDSSDSDFQRRMAVVCVRDRDDMTPETLSGLQRAAELYRSDWVSFLNPNLFIAYFVLSTKGASRADAFASKVGADFVAVRIGRAEGLAIATFNAEGKPLSQPTGGFVNDALRQSMA